MGISSRDVIYTAIEIDMSVKELKLKWGKLQMLFSPKEKYCDKENTFTQVI